MRAALPPTPQYRWPLIEQALGAEVWIKHENHTPVGAFKVRGGLTYFEELRRAQPEVRQVISATRGNHGQSVGFAARRYGVPALSAFPRQRWQRAPDGRIEVAEVFAYWCPHCAHFQPMVDAWKRTKPADVDFVYVPAGFDPDDSYAKAFFAAVFGWSFQDYGPDYADITNAGLGSGINADAEHRPAHALAVVYTAELEAARARVVEAGGTITRDIFAFPGGRRFHFQDPAGNELAVWSDQG